MSERPVITFDLDGVLCRPPFGINPGRGRKKRRDAQGKKNLLWRTEGWRYLGRRPMAGAIEGFKLLSETFECKVLSARGEQARDLTERWFRRYLGLVPEIHLRPGWEETSAQFKVRMVQELGPQAHFEDDPHTALWVADFVPRVFLVDWARNRWVEDERLHRIRSIADAVPTLSGGSPPPRML
ncbi:MAG TPA: hypothetical protein VIK11_03310 [Tepidiformaceae bacterium]